MTIQFISLFPPVQVATTPQLLYTVPATPTASILRNARVRFANTTGGAVTIEAWSVPSGGSATDVNCCLPETSISANSYLDVDIPVIASGGSIRAKASSASSITATSLDGFLQS